jgi:tetrahydromethanopterin S-methyltransferase subunit D
MMLGNIVFVTKVTKVMTAVKMSKDALLKMARNAVVTVSVF